jgi:multiple sugar transport system permease protein
MKKPRLRFTYYAAATAALAFCLFPFLYMLLISVGQRADFLLPAVPFQFTWRHLAGVLADANLHFLDYLRNSLIVSATAAAGTVFTASLGAYALARLSLPGKIPILLGVLAFTMFPQISLAGYLFQLLSKANLINTYPGLVLPYLAWTLPFTVWLLTSYFSRIPREMDEAALIDGCGHFQVLVRILWPLAAPGLFSAFLLALIFAFNEFLFALMFTTDYHARTVPVGIALFQGMHGELPWGAIMAAAAVTTVPLILLARFGQKYILEGLTLGAVKE